MSGLLRGTAGWQVSSASSGSGVRVHDQITHTTKGTDQSLTLLCGGDEGSFVTAEQNVLFDGKFEDDCT